MFEMFNLENIDLFMFWITILLNLTHFTYFYKLIIEYSTLDNCLGKKYIELNNTKESQ